jgi:hypothetical protein
VTAIEASNPLDLVMIPEELRALPQWVCWGIEVRDGKQTKVPLRPDGGGRASVDQLTSWGSFRDALRAFSALGAMGIGFVFTSEDEFCGVDLDHCTKGAGLTAEATSILQGLDSYSELSPSETGVHVLLRGRLPGSRHRTSGPNGVGQIEMYDSGRFFTMTGLHLVGTPPSTQPRQAQLEALYAATFPEPEPAPGPEVAGELGLSVEDDDLIDRASSAANGSDFDRLWRGDTSGHESHSEADLALCGSLAFWAGPDPSRIDRLFRRSGLMREKWDSLRGNTTYGAVTIAKALDGRSNFYGSTSPRDFAPTSPPRSLQTTSPIAPLPLGRGEVGDLATDFASEAESEEVLEPHSWVPIDLVALAARPPEPPSIMGLLYLGKNHLISGESEALKTWLMAAASASEMKEGHGVLWIDGDDVGPADVLERLRLFGVEDATISERFAYMLPDAALDTSSRADVLRVVEERSCRLAVFDGFNPLLLLHGLDPNKGTDVEVFYRLLDPIRKRGVAAVITDNVVKSAEARGAWAIGSERKKSKADVHLGMKAIQPLVRGGVGKAKIVVNKDRPGFLTRPSPGLLLIDATSAGSCTWAIEEDTSHGEEGTFRPTELMERVSRFLEVAQEPRSRNQIEEGVTGNHRYVRQAIDVLCAEGYAEEYAGERRARMVRLVRVYRAAEEAEVERLAARAREWEAES